jgi:hypothetical protein
MTLKRYQHTLLFWIAAALAALLGTYCAVRAIRRHAEAPSRIEIFQS